MTAFNWEYVAAHPFRFSFIMLEFGLHSISLSIRRLLTFWRTKPTNFVTAWKSLLLRIFMHRDYRYVYTASKAEIKAARRVDAPGVEAYVVSQYPTRSLASFDAVILYCHGGGYVIGEPLQCYSSFVRWTKKASQKGLNLAVFSIRYPLTGDKPFPAQRDTALGAYDYLIKQEDVSPKNIIISGDSAGGHLAASIIYYMKDHPEIPRPAGTILISPWMDPSMRNTITSPFTYVDFVYGDGTSRAAQLQAKQLAGNRPITSPEISMALAKDLKGLPPHMCIYGDVEVLEEHSRAWIENCKLNGIDVEVYAGKGAIHTFPMGGLTADRFHERESDDRLISYIKRQVLGGT